MSQFWNSSQQREFLSTQPAMSGQGSIHDRHEGGALGQKSAPDLSDVLHMNRYPFNSYGLDHGDHGLGYARHNLESQCRDADQDTGNSAASPAGYGEGGEFAGMSLTRQQIKEHNLEKGWQQWITLKGNVYETTSFRDHFIAYNKKKAAENAQKQTASAGDCIPVEATRYRELTNECRPKLEHCLSSRISDTIDDLLLEGDFDQQNRSDRTLGAGDGSDGDDDDESEEEDSDEDCISEGSSSDAEFLWKYNVVTALQKTGLSMSEIETEIRPFKIGTLQNPALPRWKYWGSIRADVLTLRDDMTNRDTADVGQYEQEYLALLQRWLHKYGTMDPVERVSGGDGNISVFMTEDPDSLREWMKTSLPFDTELPDSGAWASSELLLSPLGDTHDVFSAALRSHGSSKDPFSHDIQGKVAWAELPPDVVRNDQMTHNQQLVHESRLRRGDRARDPTLMKKRRERLGSYFREKYHYSETVMGRYLQWAAVMEQSQSDLDALCHGHV